MDLTRVFIPVIVLLSCGGLLWIGLVAVMGWSIVHPPRMSAGKAIYYLRRLSPGDLGLRFEERSFMVRDMHRAGKLNIASWWIPADNHSEKCVVLIHGYADAKIGSIGWAPLLHQLDLNILAIDLRAHGDSGGRHCTGGYFERDDVSQVIDQLRTIYPMQTRTLMLFGISLGAAVACGVAAQRSDITAMVLESPFTDYRKAILAHTRLMHLPAGLLGKAAIFAAEKLSGADFGQARPVDFFPRITCPMLIVVAEADELLDADDFRILKNSATDYWLVPEAGHLQALLIDPIAYEQRISAFLSGK